MPRKKNNAGLFVTITLLVFALLFLVSQSSFNKLKPESIFLDVGSPEPTTRAECEGMGGMCFNPGLQGRGSQDFGVCSNSLKCVIPDRCEETGGVFQHTFNESTKKFLKKCLCKAPKIYEVQSGCVTPLQ